MILGLYLGGVLATSARDVGERVGKAGRYQEPMSVAGHALSCLLWPMFAVIATVLWLRQGRP